MKMKVHFLINNCIYILIIGRFINISNKSTKTSIQIQLYTIAKKRKKNKTRVAYCKNNNNKSTNRNKKYIYNHKNLNVRKKRIEVRSASLFRSKYLVSIYWRNKSKYQICLDGGCICPVDICLRRICPDTSKLSIHPIAI